MRSPQPIPTDLSVEDCDQRIDELRTRICTCSCTCVTDMLDIARWKQHRLDLQLPRQPRGL